MRSSSDEISASSNGNKSRSRRTVIRNLVGSVAILGLAIGSRASPAKAGGGRDDDRGPDNYHDHDYPRDPRCFLRGTRISTPTGEISIESLKIGDLILTISGDAQPIRWIGRMSFARSLHRPWDKGVAPIRVSRSAIADGVPHRDVFLSPSHMLLLDGFLIPCGQLVNGVTIRQEPMASVTQLDYFHIELATHNVLLAEGLPAETLLGGAERTFFDNYSEYRALYSAKVFESVAPFAPILNLNGGREELRSRMRSAFAPLVDCRQPFDVARDRLEERAYDMCFA